MGEDMIAFVSESTQLVWPAFVKDMNKQIFLLG